MKRFSQHCVLRLVNYDHVNGVKLYGCNLTPITPACFYPLSLIRRKVCCGHHVCMYLCYLSSCTCPFRHNNFKQMKLHSHKTYIMEASHGDLVRVH